MRKLIFTLALSALLLAPLSGAHAGVKTASAPSHHAGYQFNAAQAAYDMQAIETLIERIHRDSPERRGHFRDLWESLREKFSRSRASITRAIEELGEKAEELFAKLTHIEARLAALEARADDHSDCEEHEDGNHDDHDEDEHDDEHGSGEEEDDHGKDEHHDEDGHDHDDGDAHDFTETDEHACLHVAHGPAEAMTTASAAVNASAANLSKPHTRFDLTLTADGADYHGYASYTVGGDAIYAFYLTKDIPVVIFDSTNAVVPAEKESVTEQATCPNGTVRYAADLPPGTYTLRFGPSDESDFSLVIEQTQEHDHDHDDDGDSSNDSGSVGSDDNGSGDDSSSDGGSDDDGSGSGSGSNGGSSGGSGGGSGGNEAAFDPDLDEHACLHVNFGPARNVTAAASRETAPDVSRAHTRFDIVITTEGYVSYTASETIDHVFYLTKNAPFTVYNAAGVLLPLEVMGAQVQNCPAAAVKHLINLSAGTYYFRLGPTSEALMSLVVEKSEHAHAAQASGSETQAQSTHGSAGGDTSSAPMNPGQGNPETAPITQTFTAENADAIQEQQASIPETQQSQDVKFKEPQIAPTTQEQGSSNAPDPQGAELWGNTDGSPAGAAAGEQISEPGMVTAATDPADAVSKTSEHGGGARETDGNANNDSSRRDTGSIWSTIFEKMNQIFLKLAEISRALEDILARLVRLEQKVQ